MTRTELERHKQSNTDIIQRFTIVHSRQNLLKRKLGRTLNHISKFPRSTKGYFAQRSKFVFNRLTYGANFKSFEFEETSIIYLRSILSVGEEIQRKIRSSNLFAVGIPAKSTREVDAIMLAPTSRGPFLFVNVPGEQHFPVRQPLFPKLPSS